MTRPNRYSFVLYLRELTSALAGKLKVFTKFITNKPDFIGGNCRSLFSLYVLNFNNSILIQISN